MEEIKQAVASVCKDLFSVDVEPELTRPDEQFGDYSTNVALQLAGKLNKNPREIAEAIKNTFGSKTIAKTEVAGPGFLNIYLTDEALVELLHKKPAQPHKGKTVVIEHTDPNPFKEFHIGHAYSNTIGESLGRLYRAAGANVHQVSYHGDVGLHVAKAIYGLEKGHKLQEAYAAGVALYDQSEEAKKAVVEINKKVYDRTDPEINRLYDEGRKASFQEFEKIYQRLGVAFEKQYFESETGPAGAEIVKRHTGKVFEESDGAVVFKGEKFDLHTRVFINSQGLPTYEAKELGLAFAKQQDYNFDEAVVVTANEIDQYFKVLLAALGQIEGALAKKIRHVSHGMVKLPSGKMSSRTGDVITAAQVLNMLEDAIKQLQPEPKALEENVLGALKYEFLKHRVGGDIIFDISESVSLEGNSGPYLQYAHARARSILSKKQVPNSKPDKFEAGERSLLRKITEYQEVVNKSVNELMPHNIANYLYELAQKFNSFYEHSRVIDDPRETVRLQLVKAYADTLKNGLELLNIPAPEQM